MHLGRTTLSKFLIQQLNGIEGANDLAALLVDVAAAVKAISAMTAKGALGGYLGELSSKNVQGETQQRLDVLANDVMLRSCEWGGLLAGMASEELDDPYPLPNEYPRGRYLLVFDPLDGSSNTDVNVSVGTIFSVLRHNSRPEPPTTVNYLQPGRQQVAAGYAIYGPATIAGGHRGQGYPWLHARSGDRELHLTHPNLAIPADTSEFAINTAMRDFGSRRCTAMSPNARPADGRSSARLNMRGSPRWSPSAPHPDARRGLHVPKDTKDPGKAGRLRLLYEANPITLLVEQAGGRATTGREAPARRHAGIAAPARSADHGFPQRGRAHRALPRRARQRRGPPICLAAVQRALHVPAGGAALMSAKHPVIAVTGFIRCGNHDRDEKLREHLPA